MPVNRKIDAKQNQKWANKIIPMLGAGTTGPELGEENNTNTKKILTQVSDDDDPGSRDDRTRCGQHEQEAMGNTDSADVELV